MKKLFLHDVHKKLGATFTSFSGYQMPVKYKGIMDEHRLVRNDVGVFDLSHMGQIEISGDDVLPYLERLTVNSVESLSSDTAQYTLMVYHDGGVVDDFILYALKDKKAYLAIVNASNIKKDLAWMESQIDEQKVSIKNRSEENGLLAIQGPRAEEVLQPIVEENLSQLKRFHFIQTKVHGISVVIARTGYTGEDGFEISFEKEHSEKIWQLLSNPNGARPVNPIGIGARDTLRLEMGYSLYGNEISKDINPIEAGLGWVVNFSNKLGVAFIGKEALLEAKQHPRRKLIGFKFDQPLIARKGFDIFDDGQNLIGFVCSGTVSPMLGVSIGTGFVDYTYWKVVKKREAQLYVKIRDKFILISLCRLPFWKKQ